MTMSRGLDRCGQVRSSGLIGLGNRADAVEEGVVDRLLGRLDFRMAILVQPGLEEQLEERPVGTGESHVGASHGGQAIGRRLEPAHLCQNLCMEELVGMNRHRRQEVVTVDEMGVGALTATPSRRLASANEKLRTPRSPMSSTAVPISAVRRSPWW